MRQLVFVAALLAAGTAHADWKPRITSQTLTTTIHYGGGALSYSVPGDQFNPVTNLRGKMNDIPPTLRGALDQFISSNVQQFGATFSSSSLEGDLDILIAPQESGITLTTFSGLSYRVTTRFTGRKFGILSYDCYNTTELKDISITAQLGGPGRSDSVKMTASPTSSTNCDANIGIVPLFGDFVINKVEGIVDGAVLSKVASAISESHQYLYLLPETNWLNVLVRPEHQIQLPNGNYFKIGEKVHEYVPAMISNSTLRVKFGKGANVAGLYDAVNPGAPIMMGDVLTIAVASPVLPFSIVLSEQAEVDWSWVCQLDRPPSDFDCYPQ